VAKTIDADGLRPYLDLVDRYFSGQRCFRAFDFTNWMSLSVRGAPSDEGRFRIPTFTGCSAAAKSAEERSSTDP